MTPKQANVTLPSLSVTILSNMVDMDMSMQCQGCGRPVVNGISPNFCSEACWVGYQEDVWYPLFEEDFREEMKAGTVSWSDYLDSAWQKLKESVWV